MSPRELSIKGTTRIVAEDGTMSRAALTGTETAAGMDWTADFRRTLGIVDFRSNAQRQEHDAGLHAARNDARFRNGHV